MRIQESEAAPTKDREGRIVIDCAGAFEGGAARFLRELENYLAEVNPANVQLIGVGKRLTSKWLVQREITALTARRRISLNNAGFINPKGDNITLLRNILQFASEDDLEALNFEPPLRLRLQSPVVRQLAKSSDALVVPCTRMSQQVAAASSSLKQKLRIRFHPVSQPDWAGTKPKNSKDVLLPIVPSPYKNLHQHIPEFLKASESIAGESVRLIVPCAPDVLPELASHPRVQFIGPQSSENLERWWRDCGAVFFPTEFEAFGYALAEARVYGRYVIAQDTSQNREIAGRALQPYTRHDELGLKRAIIKATSKVANAEPEPFNPADYFEWLLYSPL